MSIPVVRRETVAAEVAPGGDIARAERLRHAIEHAAHLLPAQGPITVFIHHNTLHAFEDLPFDEAVQKGGKTFGCQPYLSEERFRHELERGRIRFDELRSVLREDLGDGAGEPVPPSGTRFDLRLALLQHPVRSGPTGELRWFMAETDALRRFRPHASMAVRARMIAETRRWVMRDLRGGGAGRNGAAARRAEVGIDGVLERFGLSAIESWGEDVWEAVTLQALWRICRRRVAQIPHASVAGPLLVRHRDLLLAATGDDADRPVHELLIRFCSAFVDQGFGHWPLPRREEGFYRAFCAVYGLPGAAPDRWRRDLAKFIADLEDRHVGPLESIAESLDDLGVREPEWNEFLSSTLLALRGWAGIIAFIEARGDRAVQPIPTGSLTEYLAVRLVLDRLSLAHGARGALGYTGPLSRLRDVLRERTGSHTAPSAVQRAFPVFHLAQVLGWTPEELHRLTSEEWTRLVEEIEGFSEIERRRVFHLAYERRFYAQSLDAVGLHARVERPEPAAPRFQAMFCIDEREESIRRHVEELAPDAVTYGIAGFYFLPMYYRGAADAHYVPLCPAVMQPTHWVVEKVGEELADEHRMRTRTRRALGVVSHQVHVGSRSLTLGALLSTAVGVLASIPLVARTIFPRMTAKIREALGRFVRNPPRTRLHLERSDAHPGPADSGIGFTLDEMVNIAERVLRDTGLTSNFARIVLTLGHGSTSMNNPHESAHDCGACGGARGGPNGRAIAEICNDPRVRDRLRNRGLSIPDSTVFVGGMHNTSNETITFFDTDRLPESHREEFEKVRGVMEEACDRDAHERARRFESASLTGSFEAARQHVEGRAEDLAQVRPEWGHATNALCIVGRRSRNRGLYLDRRAFLNSYDPTQDDEQGTILARILAAAVPVCAGISLEYYFSYVDNPGYGCGTKLPHNITSLVGVMDGPASDLRTGLPWQMVEIHEPMRLLFIIETTPEILLGIMDRNPGIGRLVRNEWVRIAVLDPHSPELKLYVNGEFRDYRPTVDQLPRAPSSVDWYRGWRDHLEFAQIGEI